MNEKHRNWLMISTVGSSPEPIVASILHVRPEKIVFIPSAETSDQVQGTILPQLERENLLLGPSQYTVRPVTDGQDFKSCVKTMRELKLDAEDWISRGTDYAITVDITGGTKCMSAALALVAHEWVDEFVYVGGIERTKGGIGIVVSGKEQILHALNPWDSLGYQAAGEAILFFDQGNFPAAISSLDVTLRKIDNPSAKRELSALKLLAEAYERWDCFDHAKSVDKFTNVQKNFNDLVHLILKDRNSFEQILSEQLGIIQHLAKAKAEPSMELIFDLFANASRRGQQGRFDDAVARLYRAIELMAQFRLLQTFKIDTTNVATEKLPENIRDKWVSRKTGDKLQLALQADYELLADLGDDLAKSFRELGLGAEKSPLSLRNSSILAHGFTSVGEQGFKTLWQKSKSLCGVEDHELTKFPRLGRQSP